MSIFILIINMIYPLRGVGGLTTFNMIMYYPHDELCKKLEVSIFKNKKPHF